MASCRLPSNCAGCSPTSRTTPSAGVCTRHRRLEAAGAASARATDAGCGLPECLWRTTEDLTLAGMPEADHGWSEYTAFRDVGAVPRGLLAEHSEDLTATADFR
jgi:hypothetical protein